MTLYKVINKKYSNDNGIYIGRGSKWGNPFSHLKNSQAKFIVDSREEAIKAYIYYVLINKPNMFYEAKKELSNKNLICFCSPLSCHGDFLLDIANSDYDINYYKIKYLNI